MTVTISTGSSTSRKPASSPSGATIPWKSANGTFVILDLSTLQQIALAVGQHVQVCFAHEADLAAQITAATDAATLAPLAGQIEAFTPVP